VSASSGQEQTNYDYAKDSRASHRTEYRAWKKSNFLMFLTPCTQAALQKRQPCKRRLTAEFAEDAEDDSSVSSGNAVVNLALADGVIANSGLSPVDLAQG
jgi:hypothetical protein